ncbi:GNAT family N-acetyltransferase [Robertmurraya korlensis]|uniref:GNAT family N-acetyltransferase n=1 Tax=Robertmurraya korlensis TaxID=519977 RepID=UPI00082700C7|nr:GNAT family N-acetyltransferase [Robertmurraya korlensis]
MKFVPFVEEMLDEAALLLSLRHQQDRVHSPSLPVDYENAAFALEAVKALFEKRGVEGLAVVLENELLGFILYRYKVDPQRGRQVWIDYEGFAIRKIRNPELYRMMYAKVADKWIKQGYFQHYIIAPFGNQAVEAWLRLGFSYEQVHAINDLTQITLTPPDAKGITVRKATEADLNNLRSIATLIFKHQALAPTFAPFFPEDEEKLRDGYAGLISEPDVDVWLAFEENKLVGFQALWPVNMDHSKHTQMSIPQHSMELGIGGTIEGYRGKGIGRLLTYTALNEVRAKGYQLVVSDWRMTNLLSSTFWPKQGFKETAYRLSRKVDSQVTWAR